MPRRFQFSLKTGLLAIVFAGAACASFPLSFELFNTSRSLLGPALFLLAMSSAWAAVGVLFQNAGEFALAGTVAAVIVIIAVVFFFGVC